MIRSINQIIMLPAICLLAMAFSGVAFAEGGGDITFRPPNMDPVHFSHDYHIKSRGIRCPACHFKNFASATNGYQMQKEKLNKRDFCEHCHNGMKGFDATSEKNCSRCHKK